MTFAAVCILGGAFSSFFRCSALLMFPSILGSRGRAYLMLFLLFGLYNGIMIYYIYTIYYIVYIIHAVLLRLFVEFVGKILYAKLLWYYSCWNSLGPLLTVSRLDAI